MKPRLRVSIETTVFTWGLYSTPGLVLVLLMGITPWILVGLAGLATLIGATYPYPGFKTEIIELETKRE